MRTKDQSPADKAQAHLTVAAAALAFDVPYVDVFSRQRLSAGDIFLRQMSMYLLNTVYDFNLSRVARIFERDRTTVRHACKVIEDQRDSTVFDDVLLELEDFLLMAPAKPKAPHAPA